MKRIFISACIIALCVGCSGENKEHKTDVSKMQPVPSEETVQKQQEPIQNESKLEKDLKKGGVKDPKNITTNDIKHILKID